MIRCSLCGKPYARLPKPEEKQHMIMMRGFYRHLLKEYSATGVHAECIMTSYRYLETRHGGKKENQA